MSYQQYTITIPERFHDQLISRIMALGSLGVIDERQQVIAYFPETTPEGTLRQELEVAVALFRSVAPGENIMLERAVIPREDWNSAWKENFTPLPVGNRFVVLPPWEHHSGSRMPLIIDPGMAFGTGHHETTRSCLVLMERYCTNVKNDRFLDIGTGTGLLAIAAQKIGFSSVTGIDTDEAAIEAARYNLKLNNSETVRLVLGDIAGLSGTFDMIAANLISGTLIDLAEQIRARLASGGIVIASGILHGQEADVIEAFVRTGMQLQESLFDGKWVSLALRA